MGRKKKFKDIIHAETRWKDRIPKRDKFRTAPLRKSPNLDLYHSIFFIAEKIGSIDVEWAWELRKIHGSDWIKRYADILDPGIPISLNLKVKPSIAYN